MAADQLDDPPVKLAQRNRRHRIATTRIRAPRGACHADLPDRDPPLQSGARERPENAGRIAAFAPAALPVGCAPTGKPGRSLASMLAATLPHDGTTVSGLPAMCITFTGGGDDQLGQEPDRLRCLLVCQRFKTRLAEEEIIRTAGTVASPAVPGRSLPVLFGRVHTGRMRRTLNERSIRPECQGTFGSLTRSTHDQRRTNAVSRAPPSGAPYVARHRRPPLWCRKARRRLNRVAGPLFAWTTERLRMNVKSRSALHGNVQQFLLGVGDDELKRRRLGLCLPRCLPF
jgi:hypothetical protein